MNKIIFERIAEKRILKGLSKADLARACEITPTAYANIEKGDMNSISLDIAKEIAKALGENFDELFDIEAPDNIFEIDTLRTANELLKKRIIEIEEQLEDKKMIIKLLNVRLAMSSRDSLAIVIDTGKEIIQIYNRELLEPETLINRIQSMPLDDEQKQRLISTVSDYRM